MAVTAISRQKVVEDIDDQRWQIVLAHSNTTEFFYAVISTKIFCRPNCPSRRPRRANVRFFDRIADAQTAGFRACKRCKPDTIGELNSDSSARETVETACNFIKSVNGNTKLAEVAAHVSLSPRYFHGLFKQVTGVTPGVFSAKIRQQHEAVLRSADSPFTDTSAADTFSPNSELLVTPIMQSPLIDDYMLGFYGSADAYAELDGFDINDSTAWNDILNFEPDQMLDLQQVAMPLSVPEKTNTDLDFMTLAAPITTSNNHDFNAFDIRTQPV